jgi:hypothetical protein
MNHLSSNAFGIAAAAIALTALAPAAEAQENMDVFACQFIGGGPSEQLGDRDGHALRVATFSCLASAGPLSGGVLTGSTIYELDNGTGVLLTGSGVVRKPGLTAVDVLTEGKLAVVMTDGKVTGVTTSGKGTYPMATGSWSSLAGKSFSYSSKPTTPGLFEIDVTRE